MADPREILSIVRGMPPADLAVLLDELPPRDVIALDRAFRDGLLLDAASPRYDDLELLPHQQPPSGDWGTWLLLGGRGTGKTSGASAEVYRHVMEDPPCIAGVPGGHHVALVAPTLGDASASVNAAGGLLSLDPSMREVTRKGGTVVEFPTGAILREFGAHAPSDVDRLRAGARGGFCLAWVEELVAWQQVGYDNDAIDLLATALRLGPNPRRIVTTTPKPTKIMRDLHEEATDADNTEVVLTHGTTFDNPHLSAVFRDRMRDRYEGTRLEAQELLGRLLGEVEGALWTEALIDGTRRQPDQVPTLDVTVVSVDPAFSEEVGSDEAGIIVAGAGRNPASSKVEGYVLDDRSGDYGALSWPQHAVDAYHHYDAYAIAAEANLGGRDFIRRSIHAIDPTVNVETVHAREGKRTRGEPVAVLYDRQRAHHVGTFALLEAEMTTWVPGDASPNRLDALVWALTYLAPKIDSPPARSSTPAGRGRVPGAQTRARPRARR